MKAMVYQRVILINSATKESPTWARLGNGLTSISIDNAPNVDEKTYIDQENSNSEVIGYNRSISSSGDLDREDPAQAAILAKKDAIGDDAHTDIVIYDQDPSVAGGSYQAKKWDATVVVNSDGGGDGGSMQGIDFQLKLNGKPVTGTFSETTNTFTATV